MTMITLDIKRIALNDLSAAAEILRSVAFCGSGPGCYSTFELCEGFEKVPVCAEVADLIFSESSASAKAFYNKKLDMLVAWYWEGDGCLYIRYKDIAFINHDCKKTYRWEMALAVDKG